MSRPAREWPIQQMIDWYNSGIRCPEIAMILGSAEWQPHWIATSGGECHPSWGSVAVLLKKHGVSLRTGIARTNPTDPRRKPWPMETMISMYNDGYSLQEISDILASDDWQPYWIAESGAEYRPGQKIVNKVMKKHGATLRGRGAPGARNGFWKGGKHIDKDGYVMIHAPDHAMANAHGFVREHRLVMAAKLGRDLLPEEVVHHLDDNKQNNHESNLMLFSTNAEHVESTMKGKRTESQETSMQRKMILKRNEHLVVEKNRLIAKWHADDKLSLNQIGSMLGHRDETISRYLTKIGIHHRHLVPGTVTDQIREESRQFLASLDRSRLDAPS